MYLQYVPEKHQHSNSYRKHENIEAHFCLPVFTQYFRQRKEQIWKEQQAEYDDKRFGHFCGIRNADFGIGLVVNPGCFI